MDENNKQQNTPSCEELASVAEVCADVYASAPSETAETPTETAVATVQTGAPTKRRNKAQREQREQQLENAKSNFENREVTAPKRKKRWLSTVFFVAVIALTVVLMYQLSESAASGNEKTLTEILAHVRVDYALAAVAVLLTMMFLDSMKYFIIIHATTGKFRYAMALKTGLWGKYYDNITPFASGGQPFQVHYLYKKGFTGGESTAIISIKFCFN
ncbi:MAG: lysylphosphatidylglycerol synthase domain-containing protein, partial [Candidatus Fimimonas sp.]